MTTLVASKSRGLSGSHGLPGDKSISHRALILGTLARGTTRVAGLLESADTLATAAALRRLGGIVERGKDGGWSVEGIGLNAFLEPSEPLDMGNSGTGARLLMGAVAGSGVTAVFTGDPSLTARPMARVTDPLVEMGAQCKAREGSFLPLTMVGTGCPMPIDYESPHASAQVKSAILLAGLSARGRTRVVEPTASRDHTETMLRHFGVAVTAETMDDGRAGVAIDGEADLEAADLAVPADPSSAAFLAVAALVTEGSGLTLKGVGTNPLRFGLFKTLVEMGGDIRLANERTEGGEPVADLEIRHSALKGVEVPACRAASMIDEYPVLSVAAAFAEGRTVMNGVGELRVKETDRIRVVEEGLNRAGAKAASTGDSLTVEGGGPVKGGISVDSSHDHRIAMSFLVLGLASGESVAVSGTDTIATSFPDFVPLMRSAGADIAEGAPEGGA